MVIMDEDTCMVDMARRIMHFLRARIVRLVRSLPRRNDPGCARRWSASMPAWGRVEDIDMIADPREKNMLGPHLLPARRRCGNADDQHHEEVARGI